MRALPADERTLATALVLLIAVLASAGCAHKRPDPLVVGELREVSGTVAAVDLPSRRVTLRNSAGDLTTVQASPDVRNLEQVRVGDRVSVGYFEGIAADVKRPGEGVRTPQKSVKQATAAPGQRPAGAVGRTITSTVIIEAVDGKRHTVTFRRPDGLVQTIAVRRPESREFIRGLRVGDEVEVTYTEAVAIAVNPAQ